MMPAMHRTMRLMSPLLALAALALPVQAQDDSPYVTVQVLKRKIAVQMAQAAMTHCRDEGYQVGVSVVDRFGTLQVFVKDRYAGLHVQETSFRKAWTAVSFRTDKVVKKRPERFRQGFLIRNWRLGGLFGLCGKRIDRSARARDKVPRQIADRVAQAPRLD